LWLFVSTHLTQWTSCSTYKPRQSKDVILLIKVVFKVLLDQGLGDPIDCSLPSNLVIISPTYSFKHNAHNELIVVHKFNLEAILCFSSNSFLFINSKYKVLFDQGCWNPVGYSLEPLEVNMNPRSWLLNIYLGHSWDVMVE
jgi:hypothetical protein